MKKLLALILASFMLLSVTACADKTSAAPAPSDVAVSTIELKEPIAEGPTLLTSGGQSADYQMIGTVMTKKGMQFDMKNLATGDDLDGYKTLIVVVGGSSKGLGAAGINAEQELDRVSKLLDAAQAKGLTIIVMHTGGTARRGDMSDKFITPVFPYADYAIVVKEGDNDGLMSGICAEKQIPLALIDSISGVTTALPAAYK